MASFEEMQARAQARASHITPEITMRDAERWPEEQSNRSSNGDDSDDNSDPTPPRNPATEISHLLRRYNLPEGTAGEVEAFQRLPPSMQLIHIFLALQEIRSLVETPSYPPIEAQWRITAIFEKNVKTYVKALFVRPNIKDYNSQTIIYCMEKIIKSLRWGLPQKAENDPQLWKDVVSLIRNRAADLRSEWKTSIISSIGNKTHIMELAASLTSSVDINFKPDGPLLVCIAVLRTVCARDQSASYWPSVATELENIQNSNESRRILAEYYLEDQRKYSKPGMPALAADFTSVASSSSIVQAAGRVVDS